MIKCVNVEPYFCWHGLPKIEPDVKETVTQPKNELTKTLSSLPPMVMVTRRVPLPTASNCGATRDRQRAELMTANGQISWPPTGSFPWPLSSVRRVDHIPLPR